MVEEGEELSAEARSEVLEAWKTSESVAMHFNNLLLGFRLRAVGGVTAGAIAGIGLRLGELADPRVVTAIFVGLAVTWLLVWAADFFYYYRLLAGAVDELLRLETVLGRVRLSHLIERRVQGLGPPGPHSEALATYRAAHPGKYPSWPLWIFYSVPTIILVAMVVSILWSLPKSADSASSSPQSQTIAGNGSAPGQAFEQFFS